MGCPEWSFHLVRLLSTLFTIPLVLLTFGTLRETMPAFPAAVAVGGMITALLPSHVAISAMVNNDALVNLLILLSRTSSLSPTEPVSRLIWAEAQCWQVLQRRLSSPAYTFSV